MVRDYFPDTTSAIGYLVNILATTYNFEFFKRGIAIIRYRKLALKSAGDLLFRFCSFFGIKKNYHCLGP